MASLDKQEERVLVEALVGELVHDYMKTWSLLPQEAEEALRAARQEAAEDAYRVMVLDLRTAEEWEADYTWCAAVAGELPEDLAQREEALSLLHKRLQAWTPPQDLEVEAERVKNLLRGLLQIHGLVTARAKRWSALESKKFAESADAHRRATLEAARAKLERSKGAVAEAERKHSEAVEFYQSLTATLTAVGLGEL